MFEWFQNNLFKSNADKCHLLVILNDNVSINVAGYKIDKSDTEKLFGVKFDKLFMITSLTFVKRQVEKYLLWSELNHTWKL